MDKEESWLRGIWNLPWFRLYCLGIVIIIFLTGIKLPSAYYHKDIQIEDFVCSMGDIKGFNYYVNEELSEHGGLFVTYPKLSLDKGRYQVTVSYGAEGTGNYLTFDTEIHPETIKCEGRYDLPEVGIWGTKDIILDLDGYTEGLDLNIYYSGEGELRIYNIAVDGLGWRPGDTLAIGSFCLIFYILAGFAFIKMGKEKFYIFGLLSLAAVVSSYPYFSSALREGDDISFHLMRIIGIKDGLLGGQFPVRIYPSAYYGAGYDCGLYYPDIFLYVPALLCLLGVSAAVSAQIFGILLHFLAVWIMYYSIRKMGGNEAAGILGSIIYVFCEYFSCNFYLRADLGESVAMCFFPLVICGFYAAVIKEEKEWKPLCLGMTGLVLSHLMSALFACIFLVLFCLCYVRKTLQKDTILTCFKAAITSFGLCCWFLVPFFRVFQDRDSTNIINMIVDTQNHVLEFCDIFASCDKESPQTLGISLSLGVIFCLYGLLLRGDTISKPKKEPILALLLAGIGIAVCTTSLFPWNEMMHSGLFHDAAGLVQFPWRLLGPSSAFLAMAVGMAAEEICRKHFREVMYVLIFITSFLSMLNVCSCQKESYIRHGEAIRETQVNTDYLFRFTQIKKLKDIGAELPDSGIELLNYEAQNGIVKMNVSASAGSYVDTTLLFFTGHQAFDKDGNKLPCVFGENNRMRVQFPEDYTGEVTVRYTGLLVWRIFDIISLLNLIGWIFLWRGRGFQKRLRIMRNTEETLERR